MEDWPLAEYCRTQHELRKDCSKVGPTPMNLYCKHIRQKCRLEKGQTSRNVLLPHASTISFPTPQEQLRCRATDTAVKILKDLLMQSLDDQAGHNCVAVDRNRKLILYIYIYLGRMNTVAEDV